MDTQEPSTVETSKVDMTLATSKGVRTMMREEMSQGVHDMEERIPANIDDLPADV